MSEVKQYHSKDCMFCGIQVDEDSGYYDYDVEAMVHTSCIDMHYGMKMFDDLTDDDVSDIFNRLRTMRKKV